MALRFEDWSNNLLKLTMKKKYVDSGFTFPPEGMPFLLKVFLSTPSQEGVNELRAFMKQHNIPESYLDVSRVGRQGEEDLTRVHLDLYGDQLYNPEGTLIWTEQKIRDEGCEWKSKEIVFPGKEGQVRKI